MRRLFILLAAASCLLAASTHASAQVPILYYDFENNTTRTTFENAVEQSVNSGSGALSRLTSGTITGTTGAGTFNGGSAAGQAASTSSWQNAASDPGIAATDYFQFVVNTTGLSQISVTFDNQASATGPAAVGLMYSTNGTTFTAASPLPTGNNGFSTAVFDLSDTSAVDNKTAVTIRIYAYAGSDRTGRSAFTSGGTFKIDNLTVRARTVTASKTLLGYPAVGLSTKSGTAFVPAYTDLVVNGSGIIVTLNGELKLLGTLNVTSGTLDQGATSNLTAGTISVAAGGTLKNQGTGDLTVGSGGVANDGTVNFDGGGAACTDDILIRSNADGVQRTWSGAGAFSFIDVDAKDQKAAGAPTLPLIIIAVSSKDSGNNSNWNFTSDPTCASGSYTWVGGTGNDWQSPASWSPARLVPGGSDVLVFDGNITPAPTVNNVPTQTVAALKLINAAAVTLNASTLAASQTLTMSGAQGLLVPSASSLTLSGSNALRLNVAGGSAATIGGGMTLEGGAHRLLAGAAGAATFQSGSTFGTGLSFNGNPFGTGAAGDGFAGSIVFAGGSAYFHNAGESPFGSAGNSAVAVFQTGSTATWLTSAGFQANGRTYADLVVGKEDPGGVAVNLSDMGAGDFQFDNLTIASTASANSSLQFTGTGASTVNVRGNITSKGAGLGAIPDVTLGGGTGGIVVGKPGGGTVTFGATGNARGLDFESSAKVAAGTTLSLSRVLVAGLNASSNFVVTVEGALEGSASGYVIGKLRRQLSGTGTSVFQVGSANGYSPVTLGVTSNTNGSPAPFTVSAAASYMTGVVSQAKSVKRTYTLTSGAAEGSLTADITFQYVPAPTTSGGDVSADVIESTLNAFRREAGDTLAEFAASARAVNAVTVGGVSSFSEWTLANARPCALVVNTTADPTGAAGTVSLREAVRDVCAGGTVSFDLPADSLITLGGELQLTRNVQIVGPSNRLTVGGGGSARVFNVNSGANVYVSNLNVTGGAAGSGGAVQNSGTLALVGVSLFGNNATGDGGGAVRNDGTLNVVNSTLSGNNAASDGGALLVAAGKTATLLNTTVTDNTAGRDGNGIYNGGTLIIKNSVVAGNGSTGVDLFDAGTTAQSNSLTSGTPGLSALAFRGGPTRTHVPLPDGTTINAGTDATTLDGAADDSQTTVNVADASALPAGLLIRVDDEQMLVTGKTANALAVTRGANNTTAAAHNGGAGVRPAFDQRGRPRLAGSAPDIGAAESDYAISADAGTPQSAAIGTAFAALLKSAVTESGDPVGGLSVTFDAPAAGASGTFQGTGTNAATVTTDSGGVATAPAFNANGTAGVYAVTASLAGGSPSAGFALTNLKLGQTITFDPLPNKTFGDASFTVGATGGASGNAVTFGSQTPAFCSLSGNTVTILAAGTCTVRASQAGNGNYNAAADVDRSFNVLKAGSTTTVNVGDVTFDGQPHGATAGASGAGGLGQSVTVTYTGRNSTTYGPSANAPTNAGDYTASAAFAGDDNHTGSSDSKNFQIAKATSTTTVNCAGGNVYTGSILAPCSATVTGAGGLNVSTGVSYANNVNAGTATANASYAGDANHEASSGSGQFSIGKAASTVTVTCPASVTYDGSTQTPCSASVSGVGGLSQTRPVNYTNNVNAGTATASANYDGDDNHTGSSDSKDFRIGKAAQTITFGALTDRTFGDAPFNVGAAGGGSGAAVSFNADGKCTSGGTNGSTITLTGAGVCTVTASQAGDDNYNAAAAVQRSFQIAKAATATAVSSVPNPSGAGQSLTLTATVTSAAGTPTGAVTFKDGGAVVAGCESQTLSTAGQATCTTSALGAGGHVLTAEYSGDANFIPSAGSLSGGQTVGGSFAFSQSNYTTNERGGSVTITVRRTGDTGAAATVDYSTDDGSVPSVAVACSAATGLALERCDYTRAAGTLRFGPGETEMSFVVLVNDDSYNEGTETTQLRLSNPSTGALLGGQSSAVLEISDDATDAGAAGNPVDDDEAFVRQHYHDFLNREADADGLKFWADGIRACGSDAGCREVKRVHTSAAFFLSIEFQQTGFFAYRVHKAAFGDLAPDKPVPVTLKGFLRDTQEIGQGVVVNAPGWGQLLEANKQEFARRRVQSPEFLSEFPESMSAEAYINKLFTNSGVTPTPAEFNIAFDAYNDGGVEGRARALRAVADSGSVYNRQVNAAFVLMQYIGYLRRNPNDAPEDKLDFTGYDFWLAKLNSFGGDFAGAEMVKAFINSVEYRDRFGR